MEDARGDGASASTGGDEAEPKGRGAGRIIERRASRLVDGRLNDVPFGVDVESKDDGRVTPPRAFGFRVFGLRGLRELRRNDRRGMIARNGLRLSKRRRDPERRAGGERGDEGSTSMAWKPRKPRRVCRWWALAATRLGRARWMRAMRTVHALQTRPDPCLRIC